MSATLISPSIVHIVFPVMLFSMTTGQLDFLEFSARPAIARPPLREGSEGSQREKHW